MDAPTSVFFETNNLGEVMSTIRTTVLISACAVAFGLATPAMAMGPGHGHGESAQADSSKPVNAMCPIGNEPVEADGGSADHKGNTVGFCCKGCIKKFAAWDEAKKDEFVAMSMMQSKAGGPDGHGGHDMKAMKDGKMGDHGTAAGGTERVGDPYPLSTCPISGEEFGGMGDPIVKIYNGREVKFCCAMCVPKFEKDLKASFADLDQKIIDSQLPFYPTTQCIVSGETLGGEDMGDPINYVYNNRLVRFCCKMCKSDFKKDPQTFITKLDAAVVAQQGDHYPMTTCPVSGEELGGMGESIDLVYAGRLIKFCCEKCVEKFEANPAPTIEKIDAAWMAMHDGKEMKDHNPGESHGKDGHGKDGHHGG